MNEKNIEQQAAKIDQEVQDLMKKTDERAAQVDMEKVMNEGKKMAQELQKPTED